MPNHPMSRILSINKYNKYHTNNNNINIYKMANHPMSRILPINWIMFSN